MILNETQAAIRDEVRKFAQERIAPAPASTNTPMGTRRNYLRSSRALV